MECSEAEKLLLYVLIEAVLCLELMKRLELVRRMIHDSGHIKDKVRGCIILGLLSWLFRQENLPTGSAIHFIIIA